jgi:hypothetical protein
MKLSPGVLAALCSNVCILWMLSVAALVLGSYATAKVSSWSSSNDIVTLSQTSLDAQLSQSLETSSAFERVRGVYSCFENRGFDFAEAVSCTKPFDTRKCAIDPSYTWIASVPKNSQALYCPDRMSEFVRYHAHAFLPFNVSQETQQTKDLINYCFCSVFSLSEYTKFGTYTWPPGTQVQKTAVYKFVALNTSNVIVATGVASSECE